MAHELELYSDGGASFAYAGKPGWHGLGQAVREGATGAEMCEAARINWKVNPRVIAYLGGENGERGWIADHTRDLRALVRSDTGTVFGVVSKHYRPVQNETICTFFDAFARTNGLTMETVGAIKGGSKVWALARAPKLVASIGGCQDDEVRGYLLMAAGHDGTFGVRGRATKIRVVCANTWAASGIGGNGDAFRMTHVAEFDDKARAAAATALGLQVEDFAKSVEVANALSARTCRDKDAEAFFRRVLKMDSKESAAAQLAVAPASDASAVAEPGIPLEAVGLTLPGISLDAAGIAPAAMAAEVARQDRAAEPMSRTLRRLMQARDEAPGADLQSARGTWWGAFNAVTWEADNFGSNRDSRMNSAWFGGAASRKAAAAEIVLEMAGLRAPAAVAA